MSDLKTKHNIDTTKAAYDAFNNGDLATMKDTWADGIDWWSSEEGKPGGERHGIDSVMEMIMEMPQHWSSATVEPQEFIEAGDYVVVTGVQHFTNDKGTADAKFAHILKFDGQGKCVKADMHVDSAKVVKLQ